MRISKSTAGRIVREMKNIISYDITFMDKSARIIACTKESRVGDFHGASRRMYDEQLKELIVYTAMMSTRAPAQASMCCWRWRRSP